MPDIGRAFADHVLALDLPLIMAPLLLLLLIAWLMLLRLMGWLGLLLLLLIFCNLRRPRPQEIALELLLLLRIQVVRQGRLGRIRLH